MTCDSIRRYRACRDYVDRILSGECSTERNETDVYLYYHVRYVASFVHMRSIRAVILLQSPYARYIYPEMASAASFNPEMTRGTFQEVPATVDVIARDLVEVCGADAEEIIEWFRDSWILTTEGIIVINSVRTIASRSPMIDREMVATVRMLSSLITTFPNQGAVQVFAMGTSASNAAEKLRSSIDRSVTKVTVRTAPHPAAIAREQKSSLGKASFSKALYNVIKMTSRQSAQKARLEQERNAFRRDVMDISNSSAAVSSGMSKFVSELGSSDSTEVPKAWLLEIMTGLVGDLAKLSMASKNIVAFEKYLAAEAPASTSSRAPNTGNTVQPGSFVEVPSAATDAPRAPTMSAAEARMRRRVGSPAPSVASTPLPTPADSSATPPAAPRQATQVSATPPPRPPASVGSVSVAALRAQRRAVSAAAATPSSSTSRIKEVEATALLAMSEFMMSMPDGSGIKAAEELSSDSTARTAQNALTSEALSLVRREIAANPNYDASKELGMAQGTSANVTGATYQFCMKRGSQ